MSKNVTVAEKDYTGVSKVKLPITGSSNHAEFVSVEGTKQITTNGSHDVSAYATVNVSVESEAVAEGDIDITANGTHDVSQYARAIVNVPQAGAGIGEFTAYQSVKFTPVNEGTKGYEEITNPLGVVPKLLIVSCAEDSVAKTTNGYIQKASYFVDIGLGATSGINVATGNISNQCHTIIDGTVANLNFYVDETTIKLGQASANVKWSSETEYTLEIYA